MSAVKSQSLSGKRI